MKKITNPSGIQTLMVKQDESLEIFLEDLESGSREFDLQIIAEGDYANIKVEGVAKTTEKDHKSWKVHIALKGKEQVGELNLRGIADDASLLRFDGSGVVGEDSEECEMEINENIVLFSPEARGHALPILRVETENVRAAGHGATIAPFDEEMFFYLASRGIGEQEVKKLLLQGFLKLTV